MDVMKHSSMAKIEFERHGKRIALARFGVSIYQDADT